MSSQVSQIDPKYLRAAVYGANDGIITTFAVVAGVAGAGLSVKVVLILGIANMIADGVSMGFGDFLGERSEQRLRRQQKEKFRIKGLWKTGLVTFLAFVVAGSLPLFPYLIGLVWLDVVAGNQFLFSVMATGAALFFVGSLRTVFIRGSWWKNGLEMLSVGAVAATIAYLLGFWVESFISA
jgi:vacuolar iron transporter family protein